LTNLLNATRASPHPCSSHESEGHFISGIPNIE
jgi:hypothetical protein